MDTGYKPSENARARRKPASVQDGAADGADKMSIPDYKMWDFYYSDGLRDHPDGHHRVSRVPEGVGEDLAWDHE